MGQMEDVLDHGRDDPPAPHRWVLSLGLIAVVVAAVALAVTRPDQATPPDTSAPGSTPRSSTAPATTGPPSAPATDLQQWPAAAGACGNSAALPLLSVGPLRAATGMSVLVGGPGLRLVDVDTGEVRRLLAGASRRGGQVTDLAASPAGTHALRLRCDDLTLPGGTVLTADTALLTLATALPERFDGLLTGPDAVWAFSYPLDPVGEAMVLRPVEGGDPVTLPVGFEAAAATENDFIGTVIREGEQPAEGGFDIAAVSRSNPGTVRRLGRDRGYVVAATERFVLTYRDCDPTSRCALTRSGVDGAVRRYPLPPGRIPVSETALSEDGRYAAFQLARPDPDPRYDMGHPGNPSDIAVQDLATGTLSLVPGVLLAPKAAAGLTFSREGRWLVIALNEGRRARLLIWRPGLGRPMESPAQLPGRILYNVPVLDVTGGSVAVRP